MSVTNVKRIAERRGGRYAGAEDDSDRLSWEVTTNSKADNFITIRTECWANNSLPRPFLSVHPDYAAMLCKVLSGDPKSGPSGEEPYLWIFNAEFDTKPIDKEDREREEQPDPTLRIARWKVDFNVRDRIVNKDTEDKAFLNTVYDPYIDPVTYPGVEAILMGRKNYATMPSFFVDLIERVNNAAIQLFGREFAEKTLLFIPRGVSEDQEENGVDFRQYDWALYYNRDTWMEKRVNNGFHEFKLSWFSLTQEQKDAALADGTVHTEYKVPIEIDGERPSEPQLLTEQGIVLDPTQEVFINEWDKVESADFSILPDLPTA